jgi:hypothetical protein
MYQLHEYDDALGADCAPWSLAGEFDDALDGEEIPLPSRHFEVNAESDALELDFSGVDLADAGRSTR